MRMNKVNEDEWGEEWGWMVKMWMNEVKEVDEWGQGWGWMSQKVDELG